MNPVLAVGIGAALGFVAGAFGAYILYWVIRVMKGAGTMSAVTLALVMLGFLLKFPLIFGAGYLCLKIAPVAIYAFAVAVSVVYFGTVWRASRGDLF